MKRHILTESAEHDLDGIWLYIAEESGSIDAAERVIWRLHKGIVSVAASPGIGRRCDDIAENMRCFPVGNYIIYYRERSKQIAITHVFHGKRDQRKAWKESG